METHTGCSGGSSTLCTGTPFPLGLQREQYVLCLYLPSRAEATAVTARLTSAVCSAGAPCGVPGPDDPSCQPQGYWRSHLSPLCSFRTGQGKQNLGSSLMGVRAGPSARQIFRLHTHMLPWLQ